MIDSLKEISANSQRLTVSNDSEITLVVLLSGDLLPVRHKATGYQVLDGYLLIVNNGRVIASYNHDKWISVRE